ncbi:serine O-acetyltransferase [Buchnera aphidicola]|uniref:serine O-acetyltransferase n=1 Tax=Buchnera aphidicola TaxID=9 RepID=UPI00346466EA
MGFISTVDIWNKIKNEADLMSKKEPVLYKFYKKSVLQHKTLGDALIYMLSNILSTSLISKHCLKKILRNIYIKYPDILLCLVRDIVCIVTKDPAVKNYLTPFLYLKGFHAIAIHRVNHILWKEKKIELALYLQSRMSSIFSIDIHPAANIGSGIMLDHATGIVIGESVIIEDNVIILQSVTLGGTGKNSGKNRHPKIREGVMIGAGAKILGNIEVGVGSKIGAGSIVLHTVPSYVTVAGVPAKIVSQLDSKKIFFRKDYKYRLNVETFQYGDGI